jgi:ATP-dependent Clp protease ATP-binding subunit ClpB
VILFKPLGFDEIKSIVKRELNKIINNIHEFGYKLQFSEEVNDYLAREGFDPVYGARPLRRAIQRSVENPLSKAILAKSFKKGATIKVEIEKDRIAFR